MPKLKRITMMVTVSCPHWLTARQARKEVRTLINDQTFWGYCSQANFYDLDEDNFRAVSVKAMKA